MFSTFPLRVLLGKEDYRGTAPLVARPLLGENIAMTPRQLNSARKKLGLTPTGMARAMGVPYDTYKDWQSGRRSMSALAIRCVELLLISPEAAQELSEL